jgi:hypothetical protein
VIRLAPVAAAFSSALCASTAAHAVDIREMDVTHAAGRYTVRFEVAIDGVVRETRRLLSDFDRLTRLSDTITESRLLHIDETGTRRIKITLSSCVLFFCKTLRKVQEVREEENGDIVSRIVPAESDFSLADERWRVLPENGKTRIRYDAEVVPSFFVPPLIGPWIVKSKIRHELEVTAARLEALAAETAPGAGGP